MDDICKNKNDLYEVAFYDIKNFEIEKIISLNIEQKNCNKYRINDLKWIKKQEILRRPDILIMRPSTKLTEEEQKILIETNIKIYYVNEDILTNEELLKETINDIERLIYKSKTLKYFEIEKQIIKELEDKYTDKKIDKEILTNKLIDEFLKILKEKDEITYEHVKNVSSYVDIYLDGLEEKMSEEEISFLKKAALIHDIGKLVIPNQILKKESKLDQNEYHGIKKHVSENAYLFNSKLMSDYKEIVLSHHERYDGKGYPNGLKKDEIPYYSRIIAVLDTFDALTGNRKYVKKKSLYEVLNILTENAGTQFDPKVVESFIKGIAKNPDFQKQFNLGGKNI